MMPLVSGPTIHYAALNPKEIYRRNTAMDRIIVLNPNRANFPKVSFKVSQFVDYIHKKLPAYLPKTTDCCWLKGSWTNEHEEFPNDIDIGISISDPYFESQINAIISEFLVLNAIRTDSDHLSSQVYKNGLPLSVYFTPIAIKNPGNTSLAFLTYKSLDLDLTIFRNPSRWSFGPMDGKWLQCKGDFKRHSMGKLFAKNFVQMAHGQYCIDYHLNPIDEPATAHNGTLRVLLETTRRACLIDDETNFYISNEIYKGKPIEVFVKQWKMHQEDHFKHDTSKVIEFLNLLHIYQYSKFASSYIAKAWQQTSIAQKIPGMEEITSIIINNPEITPILLKFIQTLLIVQGFKAYNFPFNEKSDPLRPFVAIPAGVRTNYLSLPPFHGSPVHLAHSLLDSLPGFISIAKQYEKILGYQNLGFLEGIFKQLNLNTKYIGEKFLDHIESDFKNFFKSAKAHEMQNWFGRYPEPESVLQRLSAVTTQTNPIPPISKIEDSKEDFLQKTAQQKSVNKITRDSKDETATKLCKQFEDLIKSQSSPGLNEVAKLLGDLVLHGADTDVIKIEMGVKAVTEMFFHLNRNLVEILDNDTFKKAFGNLHKDILGQLLPIIFEKVLKYPNEELFERAHDLYCTASLAKCFTQDQEEPIAYNLFKYWKSLQPRSNTALHSKGCNLICNAFKGQLFKEKEIFLSCFESLITSRKIEHLRMAFTKLNEVLIHIKSPEVAKIMKHLMANSILNNSQDLSRLMYKALLKVYKRDRVSFDQLMESPGIHRGPAIVNGINALVPHLKYNGDEVLLFDTLWCVLKSKPHHTVVKASLISFDALIKRQQVVNTENRTHISLKTKERMGLILRELLQLGVPLNEPRRSQWLESIVLNLISVQDSQAGFSQESKFNRYKELGYELISLFIFLSKDPQWQEKLQGLMPKVTIVKKIDDKKESHIQKIEMAIQALTDATSGSKKGTQKVASLGQKILSLLQEMQQKELEGLLKSLHFKLADQISQAQFLLSNAKGFEVIQLAHKIHNTAKDKGLINSDDEEDNAIWIIQGYLNNATSTFDIKLTSKLMPLINSIMASVVKGKKLRDNAIDIVIEALGRLSKDSIEEQKAITQHLVVLCQSKPQDEKTQAVLVEYISAVIGDFAKRADNASYALALNLFHTLIFEIPTKEHFKLINQSLEVITKNLPIIWRNPAQFQQLMQLVELLKKSGHLVKLEEKLQFALIAAIHRTKPAERDYIWNLIQHISGGLNPKTYDTLLNYLGSILNYSDIISSATTLFTTHFKNAQINCDTADKQIKAKKLLINLFLATGHIAYVKKAFETYLSLKDPCLELAIKLHAYYAESSIETIDDQLIEFLPKIARSVQQINKSFITSIQTDLMHDQNYKIAQRMLDSHVKSHKLVGINIVYQILGIAREHSKNFNHEKIGTLLKKVCDELWQVKSFNEFTPILDMGWPFLKKQVRDDLFVHVEKNVKKMADQYVMQISKCNRDELFINTQAVFESFLPFVTKFFPDYGRKFVACYLNLAIKKEQSLALGMSTFTDGLDIMELYSRVSGATFETRKPTQAEQLNINVERQNLEHIGFDEMIRRMQLKPGQTEAAHNKLFAIQKWVSFQSIKDVTFLIRHHQVFTSCLLNKALITLSENELLSYLQEMIRLKKQVFAESKTIIDDPLTSIQQRNECLEVCKLLVLFLETVNICIAHLPILFKCADASAERLNWEKSKRLEFLKKLVHSGDPHQVDTILKLTNVLDGFYKQFKDDDKLTSMKLQDSTGIVIIGYSLIETNKDYENILSEQAKIVSSKVAMYLLNNCLSLRKELDELHPSSSHLNNSELAKLRLMLWNEHFFGLGLSGQTKKDFLGACGALRKKHQIKTAADFFCDDVPTLFKVGKVEAKGKKKIRKKR